LKLGFHELLSVISLMLSAQTPLLTEVVVANFSAGPFCYKSALKLTSINAEPSPAKKNGEPHRTFDEVHSPTLQTIARKQRFHVKFIRRLLTSQPAIYLHLSILMRDAISRSPINMATTPLTFRVATADDAVPLQPLVQSAYRGDTSRLGWTTEADLLAGERIDVEGVLAKITDPSAAVLLGFDPNGVLTACCEVVKRSADIAYFGMFAVDPRRQAGGFGRQVLAHAEDYVRSAWGIKKLEMTVIWTRKELISWYVRRGYRVTGERREFPYHELADGGKALNEDLHFEVLEKELNAVIVAPAA